LDLLFNIFPQQLRFSGLVAEMHHDGITLGNNFITVNQVGQGDGRVFLQKFGLILIKPFGSALSSAVSDLGVGDAQVFENLPDSL